MSEYIFVRLANRTGQNADLVAIRTVIFFPEPLPQFTLGPSIQRPHSGFVGDISYTVESRSLPQSR